MTATSQLDDAESQQLRAGQYNAEVVERRDVHEDLMILRVRCDSATAPVAAGQYTVLGLGAWEPRVAGCQEESPSLSQSPKLLKRAYSFSCPMLDDHGQVAAPAEFPFLEFYIVLVRRGEKEPPGLTPRLFHLRAGDRIFVGPKATGRYTLAAVRPDDHVVLVATGTGEAPHNAMVAELLAGGHRGRIVTTTCVRYLRDLGYLAAHRRLEEVHPNYRYLPVTTREPSNLDSQRADYVGKRYLQDYFDSGDFERDAALPLDPGCTHVFLCGNPAMIGVSRNEGGDVLSDPESSPGMIGVLARRGFQGDERTRPGNMHFEKYW